MVKEDVRLRLNAVEKHLEQGVRAATLCDLFGISQVNRSELPIGAVRRTPQ